MNQAKNKTVLALIAMAVIGTWAFLAFFTHASRSPDSSQKKADGQPTSQEIKVKLIVNTGESPVTYEVTLPAGSTVFDLLKQSSQTNNFNLSYQQSQMGIFIEAIAGVKNDNAANKYWLYKVNGKLANVGAASYVMRNNDTVEWYFGIVTDFK